MQNVQPLHDRVLIRPKKFEHKTPGGLHLPRQAAEREHPACGEVLALGTAEEFGIAPGDKILYGKYVGTEVKVADETLLVMREKDIMAKIDDWPR